jgi:hypothetical protein
MPARPAAFFHFINRNALPARVAARGEYYALGFVLRLA